jgi:UDP-N-acetylglucosamine--dolichyl-phosphate N-acetylglucosaminephosphotransferase
MTTQGISGVDVHKSTKPIRPEMGGVAILLGFEAALLTTFLLGIKIGFLTWAGCLVIIFVALIGMVDDLYTLRQRYKPFLIVLASLPLMLSYNGTGEIYFPFVGTFQFGYLYPIILIPLGIATFANLTNMLAGFNGLESGIGIVSLLSLGALCSILGKFDIALIAFLLGVGYLAFIRYNWFPAKIFPGDTGTLIPGAAIAVIAIIAQLEFAAIVLSIPAAIDFSLKILTKNPFSGRKRYGDTSIREDGTLEPPDYPALTHMFMKIEPMTEKKLVIIIIFMQMIYAALAIFITLLY